MSLIDLVKQYYPIPFELKLFQQEVTDTLAPYSWSGCYMDVGTGKTVVSTVLALYKALVGEIDQIIVLMPPIILDQWHAWLTSLELDTLVYRGSPVQRKQMSLVTPDAILMTFQIFKNDFTRITGELGNKKVFLIVDEAAAIRRPQTLTFKAVRDFSRLPGKQGSLLTGTAINRPHHCYGHIAIKTPDVYRDYRQFQLIHITSVDPFGEPSGFKNLDLLAANMMLQSVKISADDVLDLPAAVYSPVVYELEPAHMKLYEKLVEEKLVELDDGRLLDGATEQRLYHLCQRVILMPALFGGTKIKPQAFSLIEVTADELGMFSGSTEKMVVYTNYQESNEAAFAYAQGLKGLNPIQAYGKLGATRNLRNLNTFLTDPAVNTLIAHPGSVGIGVNLQHVTRTELFLELPITSNIFTQAVGRVLREGQRRSCIIKFAIAKGTVQETLRKRVVQKEDEIQRIMPNKQSLRKALYGGK